MEHRSTETKKEGEKKAGGNESKLDLMMKN
jgi:hypothetical protein